MKRSSRQPRFRIPFRVSVPAGIARFWRGCRLEEKLVLGAASLIVPFCLGFEYSKERATPPLPPIFRQVPQTVATAKTTAKANEKTLLVYVVGKVRKPGVQKWPSGARVFQALEKAGGATDSAAAQKLNLAALLRDGDKISVGEMPAPAPSSTRLAVAPLPVSTRKDTAVSPKTVRAGKTKALPARAININAASLEELQQLPGVGPALAARIVAARTLRRIDSLNDLDNVKGIGPKKLETMRPYVIF